MVPQYCVEVSCVPEKDAAQIRSLLEQPDRPTAVVVSDDILAVALERVCIRMGLSIPKDLSIVSFNNSLFARLTSPHPIENPDLLATKIIVPHGLIERDSCCKIG